jgi:hypothetical protein
MTIEEAIKSIVTTQADALVVQKLLRELIEGLLERVRVLEGKLD